ncbi:MAG: GntR family transcriptional regulator [bacterium]
MSDTERVPKYLRVKNYIQKMIEDRKWKPGEVIPSQSELIRQFKVGRLTVLNAVNQLVQEGYLVAEQGVGTFVTNRKWESMRRAKASTIGLFFYDELRRFPNPHYVTVLEGSVGESRRHGLNLFFSTIGESDAQSSFKSSFDETLPDAVILLGIVDDDIVGFLRERGTPFVMVISRVEGEDVHYIGTDNESGAYDAVKHLIDLGHRDIAMITVSREKNSFMAERVRGYKRAMSDFGIEVREEFLIGEPGVDAILGVLSLGDRPTAVFSGTDLAAFEVMQAARKLHLHIPSDISLVGFGNIQLGAYSAPPLTTVDEQFHKMGVKAVQLLGQLMAGEFIEEHIILLKPRLIIRESCECVS